MATRASRKHPVGPKKRSEHGGAPRRATYGGAAIDYSTHMGLMSVARLQMASWLAVRGPATARELQRGLGLPHFNSAYKSLYGMKGYRFTTVTGHPYGALWEITEDGRKWLWRFAWVSARIDLGWHDWSVPEDTRPWELIGRDVVPILLRPTALCITRLIRFGFPRPLRATAEDLGLPETTVRNVLGHFARMGWMEGKRIQGSGFRIQPEEEAEAFPRYDLKPRLKAGPHRLEFRTSAYPAMGRHVEALRVAALMSGYEGWETDHFLTGGDQEGWIQEWA